MNREELEKQLDDWLDQAAAGYGSTKARSGFEARIIANLNSRLEKRRWYFRWICFAAASAAVLLGSLYVFLPRRPNHATTEIASEISGKMQQGLQQSPPRQSRPNTFASELKAKRDIAQRPVRRSKRTEQSGFLSGRLTDQERYLIAFVQAVSAEGAVDTAQEFTFRPLQIPELEKIQALQIPKPEIPSIEIEALHIQTLNGSEEPL